MEYVILSLLAVLLIYSIWRADNNGDLDWLVPFFTTIILSMFVAVVLFVPREYVTRTTPKIEIATEVRDSTVVAVDTIYTFTFKLTD